MSVLYPSVPQIIRKPIPIHVVRQINNVNEHETVYDTYKHSGKDIDIDTPIESQNCTVSTDTQSSSQDEKNKYDTEISKDTNEGQFTANHEINAKEEDGESKGMI